MQHWKYKVNHPFKSLAEVYKAALELTKEHGPYRFAVAGGGDKVTLAGLNLGREHGLVEPILVGHPTIVHETIEEMNYNPHEWMIYSEKDSVKITQKSAQLVTSGMADILIRGRILARDFFRALFDKKLGLLKSGNFWSNIVVLEPVQLDRLLFLTDTALVTHTDIPGRLKIIKNATDLANFLGIHETKISLLAAVESVTPGMPVSLEEAAIAKMSERGQFPAGVEVDGPLSLDLSINMDSVVKKGINSPVAGKANILVVNNIQIGNMLFKSLITLCGAKSASTIVGPDFPVVLTSRSESPENILYSLALAIMMAGAKE